MLHVHFVVFAYSSGNKSDRITHREIPTYIGEDFARRQEMHFLETSAKESENVEKLFMEIARELTQHARENDLKSSFSGSEDFPDGGSSSISTYSCCRYQ